MASYSTPSQWNPATLQYGSNTATSTVQPDGLTKKQQDMSTARNPMNFNQPNQVKPTEDKAATPVKPTQVDTQKAELAQKNIADMKSKMGGAAYAIQGMVNSFLSKGPAQLSLSTTGEMKYNPTTGEVETVGYDPTKIDVSSAVAEKQAEIKRIQDAAKQFYKQDEATGKWQKKDLTSVTRGLMSYDSLDDKSKAQVDELLNIASLINEYEAKGQGTSAQAQALREQLQTLDKNGVVSGMYGAIKEYRKFVGEGPSDETDDTGMQWFGDSGTKGLTLTEIMNYDAKKIEGEIRNALIGSEGIFGGDYELGLKRQVDYESAEAKAGLEQERQFRTKLKQASQTYLGEVQSKMRESSDIIKKAFDSQAALVKGHLEADPTQSGQAALQFFTQLQTMGAKDLTDFISKLLYDPTLGLATSQRQKLAEYMGGILPGQGEGTGKLAGWINELGTVGYITVDGKRVDLGAEDKYKVLRALDSGDTEQIKEIFRGALMQPGIEVDLTKALQEAGTSPERLGLAVNGFMTSLVTSLKTLAGSRTEDAVRKTLGLTDQQWKDLPQAEKSAKMLAALKENPKLTMENVSTTADQQLKTFQTMANKARGNLKDYTSKADAKIAEIDKAIATAKQNRVKLTSNLQSFFQQNLTSGAKFDERVASYKSSFNQYAAYYKAMGVNDNDLDLTARSLAMRDAVRSVATQYPDMWAAVGNSTINPWIGIGAGALDAGGALADTLAHPKQTYETMAQFINSLVFNQNNVLDTAIAKVPAWATARDGIDNSIARAEAAKKQVIDSKASAATTLQNLADMEAQLGQKLYSPDEIAKLAQDVGRTIEKTGNAPGATSYDLGKFDLSKAQLPNWTDAEIEALKAKYSPDAIPGTFGENDQTMNNVAAPEIKQQDYMTQQAFAQVANVGKDILDKQTQALQSINAQIQSWKRDPNKPITPEMKAQVQGQLSQTAGWFFATLGAAAGPVIGGLVGGPIGAALAALASGGGLLAKYLGGVSEAEAREAFVNQQVKDAMDEDERQRTGAEPVHAQDIVGASDDEKEALYGNPYATPKTSNKESSGGSSSSGGGSTSSSRASSRGKN